MIDQLYCLIGCLLIIGLFLFVRACFRIARNKFFLNDINKNYRYVTKQIDFKEK